MSDFLPCGGSTTFLSPKRPERHFSGWITLKNNRSLVLNVYSTKAPAICHPSPARPDRKRPGHELKPRSFLTFPPSPMATPDVLISGEVVAKHSTRESCWIIVHGEVDSSNRRRRASHISFGKGNVYDVTQFLDGMHHMNTRDSYQVSLRRSSRRGKNHSQVWGEGRNRR